MGEPAIWFFSMLNQAYKLQANELEWQAVVASLPHMKDSDRNSLMKRLELAQRDISELGKTNDDYSGLEKLKGRL